MLERIVFAALGWLLLRRRRRWVTIEVDDLDLKIACDPEERPTTRAAAWERFEVTQWVRAYRLRGLRIKNLDADRVLVGGESMRMRVARRLNLPPF